MSEEKGFLGVGLSPVDFYTSLVAAEPHAMSDESSSASSQRVLRVFSRGDFYTTFGPDALHVANEISKTQDVIKYVGRDDSIPSVHVSLGRLSALLKDALLERKWGAEVYAPRDAAAPAKGWILVSKGSPGDLSAFEELLGASASTSVSMALRVSESNGQRTCAVAFVDTLSASPTLSLGEFPDTDAYTSLAACLAQYGPAEALVCVDAAATEAGDAEVVADVLATAMVRTVEGESARASAFKATPDVLPSLERLVRESDRHTAAGFLADHKAAAQCGVALTAHLGAMSTRGTLLGKGEGAYRFAPVDLGRFMRLDAAALVALNVFPSPQDSDKSMSLAGLLNRTRTAMGARRLLQWLRLPLLDRKAINARLDIVQLLVERPVVLGGVRDALRGTGDVDRLVKRLQKKTATLQDVVALYQLVVRLPTLIDALRIGCGSGSGADGSESGDAAATLSAGLSARYLEPLVEGQKLVSAFEELVSSTVDLAAAARHEYLINPTFNEDLAALDQDKRKVFDKMEKTVRQVALDLEIDDKKVKLNHANNLGYHYRISRKDEKFLRANKSYTALETRKDGVRFTSPHMRGYAATYEELAGEYHAAQRVVVEKVLEIAQGYAPIFATLSALHADLDVFASLAHAAATASPPYVRPVLHARAGDSGAGALRLLGARHPCLEVQPGVSFIANDIELVKGKSNVQIITGPNMGGKSTYIRTAGCVAVLAQMGSFVPCSSAELSVVDGVLVRVGAGDSQLKGVSTFMKEMLEAAAILKASTPDSLIIIDELGRGTSTYDGFGLAWSIAEHIASQVNAYALFATHFHELTALAESTGNIVNKHVTAHTGAGTITMLYRLRPGPCDRSFGIHVAELANFPDEVVALARAKAAELETFGKESESFVAAQQTAAASATATATGTAGAGTAGTAVGGESESEGEAGTAALERFLRAIVDSEAYTKAAAAGGEAALDALLEQASALCPLAEQQQQGNCAGNTATTQAAPVAPEAAVV
jgi:DNA mismatch repair protein MSH2